MKLRKCFRSVHPRPAIENSWIKPYDWKSRRPISATTSSRPWAEHIDSSAAVMKTVIPTLDRGGCTKIIPAKPYAFGSGVGITSMSRYRTKELCTIGVRSSFSRWTPYIFHFRKTEVVGNGNRIQELPQCCTIRHAPQCPPTFRLVWWRTLGWASGLVFSNFAS